jgi:hypothetical protein
VSAEKLQPRYRAIKLPEGVRAEVNAVAATLLTAEEAALLGVTVAAKPAVNVPTPSKRPKSRSRRRAMADRMPLNGLNLRQSALAVGALAFPPGWLGVRPRRRTGKRECC